MDSGELGTDEFSIIHFFNYLISNNFNIDIRQLRNFSEILLICFSEQLRTVSVS